MNASAIQLVRMSLAAGLLVASSAACGQLSAGGRGDASADGSVVSNASSGGGLADGDPFFVPTDPGNAVTCLTPGILCPGGPSCQSGAVTSLSGTVFDPAGVNPVFNVAVFVPNAPLGAVASGTSTCTPSPLDPSPLGPSIACDSTVGDVVAVTVSGADGSFFLPNVPTGKNIPLVFQLGKWRRQVVLPEIQRCADTRVPATLSRLPRNQGEGDIPQMAIVTGDCDRLACLMTRIGLDASEFTGPTGGGRLHVYRGAGPGPDLAGGGAGTAGDCSGDGGPCPLWSTKQELENYDMVLLGCECGVHDETKPDMMPMHDWLDEGGRLFATHYASTWFRDGPSDFQSVATWNLHSDAEATGPFWVDTAWPQGTALRNWLAHLSALNPDQTLPLDPSKVSASVSGVQAPTRPWINAGTTAQSTPVFLSFATPVGGVAADAGPSDAAATDASAAPTLYCGRAAFTDIHADGEGTASSASVPASCGVGDAGTATEEDLALEFLFFAQWSTCEEAP